MNATMRVLLTVALIVAIALAVWFITADRDAFTNPYADVNWNNVGHYHANLHTHTTFSDGSFDPHVVIDKYHELDYDILALTDHDTHHYQAWPRTLYPWTSLNEIYHIVTDPDTPWGDNIRNKTSEEWQDRDPELLNMLSIEGSEILRTHHIGSYFNSYAEGERDEETVFQEIGARDGISMFFHPGRYNRDPDWYVDFFMRHPHLVGMEIYNQVDRYPVDRPQWDRILYRMMPDNPVWGFANDDTHRAHHFGANRNVFLLENKDHETFRNAMVNGHIYLFVPVELGDRPDVILSEVRASRSRITLSLEGTYNEIEWVTHNPAEDDSHVIHTGVHITLSDIPEEANFVRAVIVSDGGRTYTQPFGIRRAG